MANNNFDAWMNESVAITDSRGTGKSVLFGDLYPILMEKPDVMEDTDWYTCQNASDFVSRYEANYYNKGYGQFQPNI